ncbi:MAG: hypothetical protein IPG99_22515 [Ignavibacteria bacterium]|nr:hypothetical protein [Ignavibacteria bacterium]
MKFFSFILFTALMYCSNLYAQYDQPVSVIIDGYKYSTGFDTSNYTTKLTVTSEGSIVDTRTYEGRLGRIEGFDLDNDGKTEVLIEYYSGGAHCCTTLEAYRMSGGKLAYLDSIFWRNGGYVVKDLNEDKMYEVVGDDDMFAYAFTSYAGSRSFLRIYDFAGDKFVDVTSQFRPLVMDEIRTLEKDLSEATKVPIDCSGDGFSTNAGEVKSILAAILGSYHSIGNTSMGYDLIQKTYSCSDKEKFVETLKNEFKLK